MVQLKDILLVGAGGFAGSIGRYLITVLFAGTSWVFGQHAAIFTVNALGSLIIGAVMAATGNSGNWHFLLAVGFCGGFTTFSTFSGHVASLIKQGDYTPALIYILLNVIVCTVAVWAGMMMINKIIK